MTFTHLMNCLSLTYGPIYAIYSGSTLSEQNVSGFGKSIGYYLIFAFSKMVLYATIIPYDSNLNNPPLKNEDLNFLEELIKTLISLIEIIFLFYVLKAKNYEYEDSNAIILNVSLGWSLADSLCTNLFYFFMYATGEEFSWEFIQTGIQANIDLIEKIAIVALIYCIHVLRNEKKFYFHIILVLIGKYFLTNLGFKFLKFFQKENNWENIELKIGIALVFGLLSKILYKFSNLSENDKAEAAYYEKKKKK